MLKKNKKLKKKTQSWFKNKATYSAYTARIILGTGCDQHWGHHLHFAGHIHRMDAFKLLKKILHGELANITRPQGVSWPKNLALIKIHLSLWRTNRNAWRRVIHKGIIDFTEKRKEEAKQRRKEQSEQPHPSCKHCSRFFSPLTRPSIP